jgi:hypothetical protein
LARRAIGRSAANLVWEKFSDVGPWAERKVARSEARDGVGEGRTVDEKLGRGTPNNCPYPFGTAGGLMACDGSTFFVRRNKWIRKWENTSMKNLIKLCCWFAILGCLVTSVKASSGQNIRVLILLLYYSNTTPASFTPGQAQANFAATTSNFYENASYGQAVITEEAHGWYALPCTKATCTWDQIDTSATAAAQADGVDTNSFDHRYYLISGGAPDLVCGGALACGTGSLISGVAWDGAVITDPTTQIHEFGHSVGLSHADRGPVGGGGSYGTDSEVLLAAQRNELNWLDATAIIQSGNYSINSVEQFVGTRSYSIAKTDNTQYILDYRQSYYGSPTMYVEKDSTQGISYIYAMDGPCGNKELRVGNSYYDALDRILITFNSSGFIANVSVVLNSDPPLVLPDTIPPSVPGNLTGIKSGNRVNLHWDVSTDTGSTCGSSITYTVYRNGIQLAQVSSNSYSDSTVPRRATVSYYVRAADASNNTSAASNTVVVHT